MINFISRTKKIILLLLLFICAMNHLFAQISVSKVDTIQMEVNIGVLTDTDPNKPNIIDINPHYVISPSKMSFNIASISKKKYKSAFNGVFIINDDQLVANGIFVISKGEFQSIKDPISSKLKFTRISSANYTFNYFSGFKMDAVWVRYEVADIGDNQSNLAKYYQKYASRKDGDYFYYVLKSVKKVQGLKYPK